jgi:hypothetical protein
MWRPQKPDSDQGHPPAGCDCKQEIRDDERSEADADDEPPIDGVRQRAHGVGRAGVEQVHHHQHERRKRERQAERGDAQHHEGLAEARQRENGANGDDQPTIPGELPDSREANRGPDPLSEAWPGWLPIRWRVSDSLTEAIATRVRLAGVEGQGARPRPSS